MASWSSLEWTPSCHGGDRGFKSHRSRYVLVAQIVERRVEATEASGQYRSRTLSGSSSKVGDSTRTGDTVGSIPTALTSIPEAQSDERPFPKRKGVGSIPTGGAGANAVRTTSHESLVSLVRVQVPRSDEG